MLNMKKILEFPLKYKVRVILGHPMTARYTAVRGAVTTATLIPFELSPVTYFYSLSVSAVSL